MTSLIDSQQTSNRRKIKSEWRLEQRLGWDVKMTCLWHDVRNVCQFYVYLMSIVSQLVTSFLCLKKTAIQLTNKHVILMRTSVVIFTSIWPSLACWVVLLFSSMPICYLIYNWRWLWKVLVGKGPIYDAYLYFYTTYQFLVCMQVWTKTNF